MAPRLHLGRALAVAWVVGDEKDPDMKTDNEAGRSKPTLTATLAVQRRTLAEAMRGPTRNKRAELPPMVQYRCLLAAGTGGPSAPPPSARSRQLCCLVYIAGGAGAGGSRPTTNRRPWWFQLVQRARPAPRAPGVATALKGCRGAPVGGRVALSQPGHPENGIADNAIVRMARPLRDGLFQPIPLCATAGPWRDLCFFWM